jgi:hypothetical protein
MPLREFFDGFEQHSCVRGGDTWISIHWSSKGVGCGEFRFYENSKGQLVCSNECMGKESIKKILNEMVDNCVLEDRRCPKCKDLLWSVTPGSDPEDVYYCRTCFYIEP